MHFDQSFQVNIMERKNYKLLEQIVRNKIPCLFISPHFDDAALSCGGLISYLSDKTKVVVVNVFTEANEPPYTLSTKVFLGRCGYKNAKKLFEQRKLEDSLSFKNLKVQIINLGFVDALWRKDANVGLLIKFLGRFIPEIIHVYKTGRLHVLKGKVSEKDDQIMLQIKKRISDIVRGENAVLFLPLSIGNHVDHVIVKDVCSQLNLTKVFWLDYPYSLKSKVTNGFWDKYKFNTLSFNENQDDRMKLIKGYKTQISGLFPGGNIKLVPEKYFWKV
ncbi:hypothetical protein A2715_04505 [Candidatus Woesebacteria bacterium RIFCSPHIGHO2_01_FULL_39_32]|nr:MAG: hypothetical protein A2715_04505 [Candidatus Woesebacteria bacterium RIFCSPHIGHO2_01_FULL_39_32]OGM37777.1 MAG: hypothetical protein A3F01_01715 [Candidatus Woesebacteria bacterium RIFCSPHIGHO2_12_FULL_38_11]OGM64809.1 MAG: hypothetical protein A2893_04115 [Candidatus Woesebacteria bacterium RIFCSPLOWO2_01_FULL_39_25]